MFDLDRILQLFDECKSTIFVFLCFTLYFILYFISFSKFQGSLLLAPQNGAHNRGAFRDFHSIIPFIQSSPTFNFCAFKPISGTLWQYVACLGIIWGMSGAPTKICATKVPEIMKIKRILLLRSLSA